MKEKENEEHLKKIKKKILITIKMRKFIIKEKPIAYKDGFLASGWGSGYVAVPKEHPYFEKFAEEMDIDIHGGISYTKYGSSLRGILPKFQTNKYWLIGFDTFHAGDNKVNKNEEFVKQETERLYKQLTSVI